MEVEYQKAKKSCRLKKLETYLSLKRRNKGRNQPKPEVAPTGCFSVYVGPEKQRFVIKAEFANHPLFKMLLEDAELEYGFTSEGPLLLPCDVLLFCKILAEMDSGDDNYGSCSPFNPGRSRVAQGCGSYGLLTPPRLITFEQQRRST